MDNKLKITNFNNHNENIDCDRNDTLYNLYKKLHIRTSDKHYIILQRNIKNLDLFKFKLNQLFLYFCFLNDSNNVNIHEFIEFLKKQGYILNNDYFLKENKYIINYIIFQEYLTTVDIEQIKCEPVILGFMFSHNRTDKKKNIDINIQDLYYLVYNYKYDFEYYFDKFNIEINTFFENDIYEPKLFYIELPTFNEYLNKLQQNNDFNTIKFDDIITNMKLDYLSRTEEQDSNNLYKIFNTYINKMFLQINYNLNESLENISLKFIEKLNKQSIFNSNDNNIVIKFIIKYIDKNYVYNFNKNDPTHSINKIDEYINNTLNNYVENTKSESNTEQGYITRFKNYDFINIIIEINEKKYKISLQKTHILINFNFITFENFKNDYNNIINFLQEFVSDNINGYFYISNDIDLNKLVNNDYIYIYNSNIELHINTNLMPIYYSYENLLLLLRYYDNFYIIDNDIIDDDNSKHPNKLNNDTYIVDKTTKLSFQFNKIINTYKLHFNKDDKFINEKINNFSDILFKRNPIYTKYIQYFYKRLSYFTFTYKNFPPGMQDYKNTTYNNNVNFSNLIINTFNYSIQELFNLKDKIIHILFNKLNTIVDINYNSSNLDSYNTQYSLINDKIKNYDTQYKIYYDIHAATSSQDEKHKNFHFYYPKIENNDEKYNIKLIFEDEFDKLNNYLKDNRELEYYNYMFETYYQNNKIISQFGIYYHNENHENEPLYLHKTLFEHILKYDEFFQQKIKDSLSSQFNINISVINLNFEDTFDFKKELDDINKRKFEHYKTNVNKFKDYLTNKDDKFKIKSISIFLNILIFKLRQNNDDISSKLLELLNEINIDNLKDLDTENIDINKINDSNLFTDTEYLIVIFKSIKLTLKIIDNNEIKQFQELSLNTNYDFNCNKIIKEIINNGSVSNYNEKYVPYNLKYNILKYKNEHIILCPSINYKVCPYYNFKDYYDNISCISNKKKPNSKIFSNTKIINFINLIFKKNSTISYFKYMNNDFIYQFTNLFILYYTNIAYTENKSNLVNYIDPESQHFKLNIDEVWNIINIKQVWINIKKDFIEYLNKDTKNIFTYQNNIIYLKYNRNIDKYLEYLDELFNNNQLTDDNLVELLSKTYNIKFLIFISNIEKNINVFNIKNINNYQPKYSITDNIFILVNDIYYNYYYTLKNDNFYFRIKNNYMETVLNSIFKQSMSYNISSKFIYALSYKHTNENYNNNLINILDIEKLNKKYNINTIYINKLGFVFAILFDIESKLLYIPFNYILNELIYEFNLDINTIVVVQINDDLSLISKLNYNDTFNLLTKLSITNNKFKPEKVILDNSKSSLLKIKSSQLVPFIEDDIQNINLGNIELEHNFKELNDYDIYLDEFINKPTEINNEFVNENLIKHLYYNLFIEYYKKHKHLDNIETNLFNIIYIDIPIDYYIDLYYEYNNYTGIDEFFTSLETQNIRISISNTNFNDIENLFEKQYNNNFVFRQMLYSDNVNIVDKKQDNIVTIYSSEIFDIIKIDSRKIRKYNQSLLTKLLTPLFINQGYNNDISSISHENYEVVTNIPNYITINNSEKYIDISSIKDSIQTEFKIQLIDKPYYYVNNNIYNFISHYNKNIFYYLSILLYNNTTNLDYIYEIIYNNILKLINSNEFLNIYHILQYYTKFNMNNSYYNINTSNDLYNVIKNKHWITELDLQFLSNELNVKFVILNIEDLNDIEIIQPNDVQITINNTIFLLKEVYYYINIYHLLFLTKENETHFEAYKDTFNNFFDEKKKDNTIYLDEDDLDDLDDLYDDVSTSISTSPRVITPTKVLSSPTKSTKVSKQKQNNKVKLTEIYTALLEYQSDLIILTDIKNEIIDTLTSINSLYLLVIIGEDIVNIKDSLSNIGSEIMNLNDNKVNITEYEQNLLYFSKLNNMQQNEQGYFNIGNSCYMNASLQFLKNIPITIDTDNDDVKLLKTILTENNITKEQLTNLRNNVLNIKTTEEQDSDQSITDFYDLLNNWSNKRFTAFHIKNNDFDIELNELLSSIQEIVNSLEMLESDNIEQKSKKIEEKKKFENTLYYKIQEHNLQENTEKITLIETNGSQYIQTLSNNISKLNYQKYYQISTKYDNNHVLINNINKLSEFNEHFENEEYAFKYIYSKICNDDDCINNFITYQTDNILRITLNETKTHFDIFDFINKEEIIDDNNNFISKIDISNNPEYLVMFIKRLDFNISSGNKIKLDKQIVYNKITNIELINIHGTNYNLKSLIIHYGNANSGHYVNYSKKEDGWYLFSDIYVSKLDETIEQILDKEKSNITHLLYEKMKR